MIKVAVFGSNGRMGQEICQAVQQAKDMELVAAGDGTDDRAPVQKADVVVDFTHPDAVMDNISWCVEHGIHAVVGTTGFTPAKFDEVRSWLDAKPGVNLLIAPNFSIAAVLMMHFAAKAAPFFESAEVIELHHPRKVDAPSGTAVATALKGFINDPANAAPGGGIQYFPPRPPVGPRPPTPRRPRPCTRPAARSATSSTRSRRTAATTSRAGPRSSSAWSRRAPSSARTTPA